MQVSEAHGIVSTLKGIYPDKDYCFKTLEGITSLWLFDVNGEIQFGTKMPNNDSGTWRVALEGNSISLRNNATKRYLCHEGVKLILQSTPHISPSCHFAFYVHENSSLWLAKGGEVDRSYWIVPHLQFYDAYTSLPRILVSSFSLINMLLIIYRKIKAC